MKNPFETLYLLPAEEKKPHVIYVGLIDHSGRYKIGPPARPKINHDNGHLDAFRKREPTAADRAQLAKWVAILHGAEALCTPWTGTYISKCGGDLVDANAAYRHFLFGKGADRFIEYDRFLKNDDSGKKLLVKLFTDFKYHATIIGKDRIRFSLTSEAYAVANGGGFFEGPVKTNWVRTIDCHSIWVSADVTASATNGKIVYAADLTIHMEDRYNFNPKQVDAQSGIADAENGVFEICGLAHQYTTYGTAKRALKWEA